MEKCSRPVRLVRSRRACASPSFSSTRPSSSHPSAPQTALKPASHSRPHHTQDSLINLDSTCSRWTSLPRIPSSTGTRPSSSDILPSSPSSWDPSRPASSPALTSLLLSYNDRGAQAAALLTPPAYILNALRTKHYSVNSFLRANAFFVFLAGPPIGAAVAQLRMRSYTTKEEVKQRVQALAVDVSRLLSS